VNELRAISELPLGKLDGLNDRSEKGRRIWHILEKSERTRDVSLLEEAGRLLWEQTTRRLDFAIDRSFSYAKEVPRDGLANGQTSKATQVQNHGAAVSIDKDAHPNDRYERKDDDPEWNGSGTPLEKRVSAVEDKASVEKFTEYRELDSEAYVTSTTQAKLDRVPLVTPTENSLKAWARTRSNQKYIAQGHAAQGFGTAQAVPSSPTRQIPIHNNAHHESPSWPRHSDAPTTPQHPNTKSG
jgi:hypothetical protein